MRVISFFNHKGGVGKTTLIFNIGIAMAKANKSVLFIDADPQANLTGIALTPDQFSEALDKEQDIYHSLLPVINTTGDFKPRETYKASS